MHCRRNHGSTGAPLILKAWFSHCVRFTPKSTFSGRHKTTSPLGAGKQKAASRQLFSSEKKGNDEGYSGHQGETEEDGE